MEKPLSLKDLACNVVASLYFNALVGLSALSPVEAHTAKENIKRVREYFEENLAVTVLKSARYSLTLCMI